MTMTPDTIERIDEEISIGDAHGHIACCEITPKKFLCGAPYHPECEDDEVAPDCADCVGLKDDANCGFHQHCPLRFSPTIVCPNKGGSA